MKNLKYVFVVITLTTSFSIAAQEINEPPLAQLPSDETHQSINETYGTPSLRSAPGDGPAIGEVITPISNYTYANLLLITCAYIMRNGYKKRNSPVIIL